MADFTITHRVEAPALVDAINNLANVLSGGIVVPANGKTPEPKQATPAPVENPTPAPVAPTAAPVSSANAPTPADTPTAPANADAPSPVAKAVTFDEIVTAGSQLLDAGRMNDLLGLLKGFGVQAITQLKPEQYADVAVALRGLGAKI